MTIPRRIVITLLVALVVAGTWTTVFAVGCDEVGCWDDGCDGNACSNNICRCDEKPQCSDIGISCETYGGVCDGNYAFHVDECNNVCGGLGYCGPGGGGGGGCVGNEGADCTNYNACGMPGSAGSVQCDGSCSAGAAPPDSACNKNPFGSLDVADCTAALGWVFDPDYAGATSVHIYMNAQWPVGTFGGAVPANLFRPDVQAWAAGAGYAPPDRTNSGWSWTVPAALKDGQPHDIWAYGINVNSAGVGEGSNPLLWSNPKTITCNDQPTGNLSSATCGTATGSATDAQGSPVAVAIYDGSSGAGGTEIGTGTGPNFTIPFAPFTNGQVHTIYAYAQDIPSGTWYQLTNTQAVSCAPTVTLNAAPAGVAYGSATTLSWTVSGAASCTGSPGGWFNAGTIINGSGSGSASSGPLTGNTTFTLTCTNAAGQSTVASRTVTVTAPPPTASVVNVTDTNYCAVGPGMVIDWKYESVARPIGAYQVQVLKGATVVFDTGKIPKTASAPHTPTTAEAPAASPWARILSLGAMILQAIGFH